MFNATGIGRATTLSVCENRHAPVNHARCIRQIHRRGQNRVALPQIQTLQTLCVCWRPFFSLKTPQLATRKLLRATNLACGRNVTSGTNLTNARKPEMPKHPPSLCAPLQLRKLHQHHSKSCWTLNRSKNLTPALMTVDAAIPIEHALLLMSQQHRESAQK